MQVPKASAPIHINRRPMHIGISPHYEQIMTYPSTPLCIYFSSLFTTAVMPPERKCYAIQMALCHCKQNASTIGSVVLCQTQQSTYKTMHSDVENSPDEPNFISVYILEKSYNRISQFV